jgi:hypothetical protein
MTTEQRQAAVDALGITMNVICLDAGAADIGRLQKGRESRWMVQLTRNGVTVETEYHMGCGHRVMGQGRWAKRVPSAAFAKLTNDLVNALKQSRPTRPTLSDVLWSLSMDGEAGNELFENWCDNFGYDTDSRKALATYEACQQSGIKLRKLGLRLADLQTMFQDY